MSKTTWMVIAFGMAAVAGYFIYMAYFAEPKVEKKTEP